MGNVLNLISLGGSGMSDGEAAAALGILGLGLGFIMFLTIIGIVLYVLMAMGLKKMADNKGIENSWLAFIPIANGYIMGLVVGDIHLFGNVIPYTEWILVGGSLVSFVPVIGQILAVIFVIYTLVVMFQLYKMYAPGKEVLYLVISIVFAFMGPMFVFMIRNNTPVEIN